MEKRWIGFALAGLLLLSGCTAEVTVTPMTTQPVTETISEPWDDELEGSDGIGAAAVTNTSGLTSFSYSFDNSIGGDSWQIRVNDGTFFFETMAHPTYGEMEIPAETLLSELNDLYLKYNAARWEGFHKYDPYVLDGSGFSLSMGFQDGASMDFSGTNCAPEGSGEFLAKVEDLLRPFMEEALSSAQQTIIDRGITGNLTELFIYVTGPEDRLVQATVYDYAEGSMLNLRIEGEEPLEFNGPTEKPVDLSAMQVLLEKYQVINWVGMTTEENSDHWYQLSFYFDDGSSIDCEGSGHPENFEEFYEEAVALLRTYPEA